MGHTGGRGVAPNTCVVSSINTWRIHRFALLLPVHPSARLGAGLGAATDLAGWIYPQVLGHEAATDAVARDTHLLRSQTIRAAWKTLVAVLGDKEAAVAVAACPRLLTARGSTIRDAMPALVETLGETRATAVVRRRPQLLTARVETIRDAMGALQAALGDSAAAGVVERSPGLLKVRAQV